MPRRLGETRHIPDRLFDTWIYKVKDVEFDQPDYEEDEDSRPGPDQRPTSEKYPVKKFRVKNKIVEVKVYYIKKTSQSEEPPHPTEELKFEIRCSDLEMQMRGTDLEMMRAAVWDRLDKKFEIKWEYYYLVEVKENRPYRADGTGITFSYDGVYRGTTWDGKFLLKQHDGSTYKIKGWPGEFTDNGGNVIACIPATEDNKRALEEFCARMNKMRELMADYLRPEKIMQTLANLSGTMPFLPAPKDEPHTTMENEPTP